MKVYAPKGHLNWLKDMKSEGRTRCIVIHSFPEYQDDEEIDLQINEEEQEK